MRYKDETKNKKSLTSHFLMMTYAGSCKEKNLTTEKGKVGTEKFIEVTLGWVCLLFVSPEGVCSHALVWYAEN